MVNRFVELLLTVRICSIFQVNLYTSAISAAFGKPKYEIVNNEKALDESSEDNELWTKKWRMNHVDIINSFPITSSIVNRSLIICI